MSQITRFSGGGGGGGTVITLTGNTGGAVGPNGSGNIDIVGDGTIDIVGDPGTNTLTVGIVIPVTVPDGGTGDESFTAYAPITGGTTSTGNLQSASTGISNVGYVLTSTGAASLPTWQVSSGGSAIMTIDGNTGSITGTTVSIIGVNNISTTETSPTTLSVSVTGTTPHAVQIGNSTGSLTSLAIGTNGQVLIGAGSADPEFATLTSTGGTISFTAGANTLNLETGGTVTTAFITDTGGPAIPSAGSITLHGGSNISTSGSGSTVTFNLSGTTQHSIQIGSGSGSLTSLGVATNGQLPIGSAGADPVLATITAGTGISVTNGAGSITIASTVTGGIVNINGNTGTTVSGTTITVAGGNNITTTGSTSLLSIAVTGTTTNSLQLGNASGSLTSLGVAANGQIPIGSTGTTPVLATLTAGTNVSITNAAGSITISASTASETANYTGINHASSPYTALTSDYYISADVTAGVITVLLPNAPATGRIFVVKDKVGLAATSNITVTTVSGTETIDGATTFVMNTAYESANFIYNGSNYEVF